MTIYTKPRLRLTPAEERAADVMEWVHDRLWEDLRSDYGAYPGFPSSTDAAVVLVTSRLSPYDGLEDIGPNPSLAAIALLQSVASWPEYSLMEADDPMRLDMHDDGGEP